MVKVLLLYDSISTQIISVPLRPTLTGPISNRVTSGELFSSEILEKLNSVELTINWALLSSVEPVDRM